LKLLSVTIGLQNPTSSQQGSQNMSKSLQKADLKKTAQQRKMQALVNEMCRELSKNLSKETDMATLQDKIFDLREFLRQWQQHNVQTNAMELTEGKVFLVKTNHE
jgi:ribosomal protein S15P/S13E